MPRGPGKYKWGEASRSAHIAGLIGGILVVPVLAMISHQHTSTQFIAFWSNLITILPKNIFSLVVALLGLPMLLYVLSYRSGIVNVIWKFLAFIAIALGLKAFFFNWFACEVECWELLGVWRVPAGRVVLADYLGLQTVSGFFVFFEANRYRMPFWEIAVVYLVSGVLMGFETFLPLFFVHLIAYERALPAQNKFYSHAQNSQATTYLFLAIAAALAWFLPLYQWGQTKSFVHYFEDLAVQENSEHILQANFIFAVAIILYAIPQVKSSNFVLTGLLRIGFIGLFFINVTVPFATFLMMRELTVNKTFMTRQGLEKLTKRPFVAVQLYSWWKIFCFLSVLCAILEKNLHFEDAIMMVPILMLLVAAVISFTGWGFKQELYEQWMIRNIFSLFAIVITSIVIILYCWADQLADEVQLKVEQYQKGWGFFLLEYGMGFVLLGGQALSLVRGGSKLPLIWQVMPMVTYIAAVASHQLLVLNTCQLELGREYVPAALETTHGPALESTIRGMLDQSTFHGAGPATRVQHGKAFGCVLGSVEINEYVPLRYRHGVFGRQGHDFPAYIRFSPGARDPTVSDMAPGVRGMAIKMMGVDGPRVLEGPGRENHTQDILLISHPTFFTKDTATYPALFKASEGDLIDVIKWVINGSLFFWNWHLDLIKNLADILSNNQEITSPLADTYYSTTPYRMGRPDQAVKYSVVPCHGYPKPERLKHDLDTSGLDTHALPWWSRLMPWAWSAPVRRPISDEYMRYNMHQQLAVDQEDACFYLRVQDQESPCGEPIEDPTRQWHTPWAVLATIKIPPQEFLRAGHRDYCENLAFNPWNARIEHKPLGAINAARKPAYSTGSGHRRYLNNASAVEPSPDVWHSLSGPLYTFTHRGSGNTRDFNFGRYPSPYQDLPRHIRDFPEHQQFDAPKFQALAVVTVQNTLHEFQSGVNDTTRHFNKFQHLDDYRFFFDFEELGDFSLKLPDVAVDARWMKDSEFARQMVAGVNPMVLTSVAAQGTERQLPAALDLRPENMQRIEAFLKQKEEPAFATLKERGRLFFADYGALEQVVTRLNRVVYPAIGVFYLDQKNTLMPLGIQLTRHAHRHNQIFLPNEENIWLWIFARMHMTLADGQIHEMVSHLCFTHLAMEPVIIAFYRQLGEEHSILKMMTPHFRQTLAINHLGRQTLLAPEGSTFDGIMSIGLNGSLQLMNLRWQEWNFVDFSFPNELRRRGFFEVKEGVTDNLPGFYYRDDGFLIWNAIARYVHEVVDLVYSSDSHLQQDRELQALRAELIDPERADVPGVPELTTKEHLRFFLSTILWTCSAQHSAVNFGQYDYYAFVPNRPLLMTLPMPSRDQQPSLNEAYILSALPSKDVVERTIATANLLSLAPDKQLHPKTQELLARRIHTAHEENSIFYPAFDKFMKDLGEIQKIIYARNEKLKSEGKMPYRYLEPNEIAASISI